MEHPIAAVGTHDCADEVGGDSSQNDPRVKFFLFFFLSSRSGSRFCRRGFGGLGDLFGSFFDGLGDDFGGSFDSIRNRVLVRLSQVSAGVVIGLSHEVAVKQALPLVL